MKPTYPTPPSTPSENDDQIAEPGSRLLDEKISDDSGFETVADRALAPAGLNNPFWK